MIVALVGIGVLMLFGLTLVVLDVITDRIDAIEDITDIQRKAIVSLAARVERLERDAIRHHETVTYN